MFSTNVPQQNHTSKKKLLCEKPFYNNVLFCRDPRQAYYRKKFMPDTGKHQENLLETACRIGWLQGVHFLLDNGACPKHGERKAFINPPCALFWACRQGHEQIVEQLLEFGGDVNCPHKGKISFPI